jgi:nucleoid-associated protein YgaU
MSRNNKRRTLINDSEYYEPLRKSRNVKAIEQYATPIMLNPTILHRAVVKTTKHVWKYGDRFYNLADKYYGDARYWWVIAWWNGYGVEADVKNGSLIRIPIEITDALKVLGV